MTCTECKFRTCTNCDREFHDGETCDEYTERMGLQSDLIQQSEEAIEQMSKQCPGCKSRIEKNGGCDHMICKLFPPFLRPLITIQHGMLTRMKVKNAGINFVGSATQITKTLTAKATPLMLKSVNTILGIYQIHMIRTMTLFGIIMDAWMSFGDKCKDTKI